jgi:hypothetical protein
MSILKITNSDGVLYIYEVIPYRLVFLAIIASAKGLAPERIRQFTNDGFPDFKALSTAGEIWLGDSTYSE